jgi:serine protease
MKGVGRVAFAVLSAGVLVMGASAVAVASSDVLHGNVAHNMHVRGVKPAGGTGSSNLFSHGGAVETVPGVYIVYWGWTSDPSGEAAYQKNFFTGVGGSTWINSTTQYCQNVPSGTYFCSTQPSPQYVTNPSGQLKGTWSDNTNPVPNRISQSALAAEAVKAAAHFGNTTAAANASKQYIIDTPTGHSTSGFKTRFCAWHSSTSSSYGNIAYTNFPYQTDAGANCGQNFVNGGSAGTLDGVSIVGGHEYGESISDQFPNGGWLDSGGAENGDKCAWISSGQGAATNITLSTGSFAVQSLWSNSFNKNAGGCVVYYASSTNQH